MAHSAGVKNLYWDITFSYWIKLMVVVLSIVHSAFFANRRFICTL